MKTFVAKLFLTLVLVTPISCFADMLGCHTNFTETFKIEHTKAFLDYDFYISQSGYDSTLVVDGKDFSYETNHPIGILLYAIHKQTGRKTRETRIESNPNQILVVTIQKIENDSIYFKTEVAQTQSAGFNSKPVSPLSKLLLLISFCGLLLYATTLIFRKQKT